MKKHAIALTVLLAGTLVCGAADPQSTIRTAAEQASEAVVARDIDAILDSTYPKLIEQVGGRESMREMLARNYRDLEKAGQTVISNKIVSVSAPLRAGAELHAVVRTIKTVKMPGGKRSQDTFLIAVSGDEGQSWTFVGGSQLTPDHIKILFPDFNTALELPETEAPVFEADP